MMSVPGRAGILSPRGLYDLGAVFCFVSFFLHVRRHLLNCIRPVGLLMDLEGD